MAKLKSKQRSKAHGCRESPVSENDFGRDGRPKQTNRESGCYGN